MYCILREKMSRIGKKPINIPENVTASFMLPKKFWLN